MPPLIASSSDPQYLIPISHPLRNYTYKHKVTNLLSLSLSTPTGYSKLGNETTAHSTDWREQIDLSTPHPYPLAPTSPRYHNLLAPNQWPRASLLPHFRPTFERYITNMSALSREFTALIAEALLLPPTAFDRFFDPDQQHKLKIVKYPDRSQTSAVAASGGGSVGDGQGQNQGVGPHKDSMLTSYLLQVPPQRGLQAQNLAGEWIECPPLAGTLVVAIGQGLEALTQGVCKSTTHRVISPAAGVGPRFSVPFFQGVSYDATFESVDVPAQVREMAVEGRGMGLDEGEGREETGEDKGRRTRRGGRERRKDDVEFTFVKGRWSHLGQATLMNRIKSHPDVGERWYPDLLQQIREQQQAVERERKERTEREGDGEGEVRSVSEAMGKGEPDGLKAY